MAYAIIETGGKQLRVEPGRFYDVEKLEAEPESVLDITQVLLVRHDDGIVIGQPIIEDATVHTRVLQHGKAKKIIVYKMRPKKGYRRKKGHRQQFTRLMVETITLGDQSFSLPATEQTLQVDTPES